MSSHAPRGKTFFRLVHICFLPVLVFLLIILSGGCKNKETYKREIERQGMTYSTKSFLDVSAAGSAHMIELFLKAGMDINTRDDNGETALMTAGANNNSVDLIRMLIREGADVNAQDNNGYTVLMFVSSRGDPAIAKLLVEQGADMNVRNSEGQTALMLAALHDDFETAKLLVEKGADIAIRDNQGKKAMHYAYLNGPIKHLLRAAVKKK